MTLYSRGRVELEAASDSAYQNRLLPPVVRAWSSLDDNYKSGELYLAATTNTAIVDSTYTKATHLLIVNDTGYDIIVKGAAGDTGITVEGTANDPGLFLIVNGDYTSSNLLLYCASACSVKLYAFGT